MNKIDLLYAQLALRFPAARLETDKPLIFGGEWFVDLRFPDKLVVVSFFQEKEGFGVSDRSSDSPDDTPFDGPDLICPDLESALDAIAKILES